MKRNGNAERREHENRGPEGAEGGGVWGEGITLPNGGGAWKGGRAPSPENVLIFYSAMVHFGAFWALVLMLAIRRMKQSRKAVLCANCQLVSYLTWLTYHGKLQLTIGVYRKKTTATTFPLYK